MKRTAPFLGLTLAAGLVWPLCVGAEVQAGWRVGPTAWSFRVFTFHEAVEKTASLKP